MGAYVHSVSEEFEEMERIPWAALAASTPDPRRRIVAAGIGLVALLALLLIAGGALLGSGTTADTDLSVAPRNSASAFPTDRSMPDSGLPEEAPAAPTEAAIYSEADLMASSADAEVRIAAMWAERFVRDYLTVDGDGSTAAEAARLVAAEMPESPEGLTCFVEWVDAYAITAVKPARYRVEVAYRLLTGSEGSYNRNPAAAMAVTVAVDVDGTAALAGLPEAITMPTLRAATAPTLTEQIPDRVLEQVSGTVVGGYRTGSVWWVVVMSELAPGVTRPHVVGVEG